MMNMMRHEPCFGNPFPRWMIESPEFRNLLPDAPYRYYECGNSHVKEEEERFVLQMALPGIPSDCINVTVKEDILTVKAQKEKKNEESEHRGHCFRMERSWNLEGIDRDGITAESRYGMLYVYLPKEKPAEPVEERRIPVLSSDMSAVAVTSAEAEN